MNKTVTYFRIEPNPLTGQPRVIQAVCWAKHQLQWILIDTAENKITTALPSILANNIVRIWGEHGQLEIKK